MPKVKLKAAAPLCRIASICSSKATVGRAGALGAGYTMLRLPHGLGDLFGAWLDQHYPDRKEKILGRVREMRGGQLNDPRFGVRMRGEGPLADAIQQMFRLAWRKQGYTRAPVLSTARFRRPEETPRSLFDGIDDDV